MLKPPGAVVVLVAGIAITVAGQFSQPPFGISPQIVGIETWVWASFFGGGIASVGFAMLTQWNKERSE